MDPNREILYKEGNALSLLLFALGGKKNKVSFVAFGLAQRLLLLGAAAVADLAATSSVAARMTATLI